MDVAVEGGEKRRLSGRVELKEGKEEKTGGCGRGIEEYGAGWVAAGSLEMEGVWLWEGL